jgi:proline dehydrogenase
VSTPEHDSLAAAAAALRRLARRDDLKAAVLATPGLYAILRQAALRYVAGETRDDALAKARVLASLHGHDRGHRATIDFMGEDTRELTAARAATDEFLALVDALGPSQQASPLAHTSVSLDLSHIGLAVDGGGVKGEQVASEHLEAIVAAAARVGREVVISMEASDRTDAILAVHDRLATRHVNLGITVQAALHRTPSDLDRLLARAHGGRIRLVKGAYLEPVERAVPRGDALDARYLQLAQRLLEAARDGQRVSLATHHDTLLMALRDTVHVMGGPSGFAADALQFEMLQGVTPTWLDDMAAAGFATRVYLVYGREWYLYLCHRLAEHPPSLFGALVDAVDALPRRPDEPETVRHAMLGSSARPGRAST